MRMLIVDDEYLIAQGIQYVIQKLGTEFNQVDVAFSGKEALEKLSSQYYDLLLTDVNMQEMTGLELIQEVKRLGLCNVICILSGYAEFEYARSALSLGVSQYLLKPVDKEKLYKLLEDNAMKVRAEQKKKRRDMENRISEILFGGISDGELILSNGEDLLTSVAIGDPLIDTGFSHQEFCQFYTKGLAECIVNIYHYPALLFFSKPIRKTELMHELAEKCSTLSVGTAKGPVTSIKELRRRYIDAGQAALYARYILNRSALDSENFSPFPVPVTANFEAELQRRFSVSVPENHLVLFQIGLQTLLGNNYAELKTDSSNQYVQQMLDLVKQHFREDLALSDIAHSIGLNPDYAGRLFKSEIGVSFQEFLNHHRITHILKCMQQNPMLSFEQLAPCMGFLNMRNFYRVFRRIMKMTPGEYKKAFIHSSGKGSSSELSRD